MQPGADEVLNLPPDGVWAIPVRDSGDRSVVLHAEYDGPAVGVGHRNQRFRDVANHLRDGAGARGRAGPVVTTLAFQELPFGLGRQPEPGHRSESPFHSSMTSLTTPTTAWGW